MKIVLLCWRDSGHPEGGGSETYLERVGSYLAAQGHEVIYRTAHYEGAARTEATDGFTTIRGGGNLSVYPRALAWLLKERLRGRKADVIVDTQNGVPFFAHLVGGAPTVMLTHHCHKEQWSVAGPVLAKLGWFIESTLSPLVHRSLPWVTVSEPSAEEFAALGVPRDNISIIRNGIDPVATAPFTIKPESVETIRLVTLSRLVPHKQLEHAIFALSVLVHDVPEARLDIVGDGWWMNELKHYAHELGVEQYVEFHGFVSEEKKHLILSRASIHVMPSRKEGWGLAVIEAGQHGVPTIGYRSSAGLRDSIIDGETGILVDNEGDLIHAVEELLRDPARRKKLGHAAEQRAQSFSWAATGAAWENLLASIRRKSRRTTVADNNPKLTPKQIQ